MRPLARNQLRHRVRLAAHVPASTGLLSPSVAQRIAREPETMAAGRANKRPPFELTDDELLALVHRRAVGVEALLYRRFSSLVHRLVWRLLGPDTEYQDTTHDAFIRIFRGIVRLRDPSRLEDWVLRVTINTVKNEFRKRRIRRFISWDAWQDPDPLPAPHPDFEHRELLTRTYRILERLPPEERIVLTLDLFEPRSIAEIAAEVGLSTRTVKRRLRAGRARFERMSLRDPVLAPWVGEQKARGVR
jgi:RNA polymerase sigma-70 factor (ECF subfamily)